MKLTNQLKIRQFRPEDEGFVYSSWLNNYWGSHNHDMTKTVFMAGHHNVIEKILQREGIEILIAANIDDDEQILGYLVREGNVLHYLYVKSPFRRSGISAALLEEADFSQPVILSHKTVYCDYLKIKTTFNPYLR